MKCEACGVESENGKLFRTERRTLSSRSRTLCLGCDHDKVDVVYRTLFCICVIPGLMGLLIVAVFPRSWSAAWPLLFFSLIMVVGFLSTLLHEIGHAVAGSLSGYRIFCIMIGRGNSVLEFRCAGVRWSFRAIPFGGLTIALPAKMSSSSYRLKRCTFLAGGPLTNLLLALLSWRFLALDDRLVPGRDGFGPIVLTLLLNAGMVVESLWPHLAATAHGKRPNDGLALWRTWRKEAAKTAAEFPLYYLFAADECRRERRFAEAHSLLATGLRQFPGDLFLCFAEATTLIFEDRLEEARNSLRTLMPIAANRAGLQPQLLNNLAYVNALLGRADLLSEADALSKSALESEPWNCYFQGTRGIVLVEMGQFNAGVSLLTTAMRKHPDKWGKAINACYLGIAAARQGQSAESVRYFALARKWDSRCPLLTRVATARSAT